jgi:adenylosuccinate synthase
MIARAVIGANWGDEGKGLMTDYFSSLNKKNCLVIRFNGGAQAGHTVELSTGIRHVFHHLGSGIFNDAVTYLSEYFVVNPLLYQEERTQLLTAQDTSPQNVHINPACMITTPYDMIFNQALERERGKNRHGSCGIGYNQTIERDSHASLRMADLRVENRILREERIERIRKYYLDRLDRELSVKVGLYDHEWSIMRDERAKAFHEAIDYLLCHSHMERLPKDITREFDIVFEGAQGLLLDEQHGIAFPYLTRSSTGLKNVVSIVNDLDITEIDVTYVTRAYMTRHGAGPFPTETEEKPYAQIKDPTNIDHPFQGKMRYGWLDLDLMHFAITNDMERTILSAPKINPSLAVTCVDHVAPGLIKWISEYSIQSGYIDAFMGAIKEKFGESWTFYMSSGPTRETIE